MKRFYAGLVALMLALSLAGAPTTAVAAKKPSSQTQLTQTEVKRVQQRLIDLGFLDGKADGVYGKQTQSAVKAFQAYAAELGYDLAENGVAGGQTLKLLFDDAVAEQRLTVKLGDKGAQVRKMQERLLALGYLSSEPDGVFGPDAERALLAFQGMLVDAGVDGAEPSGACDALTRAYLYERDLSEFDIRTPVYFDDSRPLSLEDCYLFSESCILIDADSGEVLYAKNEREKMYPASTTKIMTLLLGLTRGSFRQTVTVPEAAAKIPGDSSRVPVQPGEQMPYIDLLYGLILRSGNDAANAIAELTSGSVEKFVNEMNEKARSLGMSDTHFTNAHGYHDSDHYTTAFDMATLMRCALQDERARTVIETRSYTMAATAQRKNKGLALTNTYDLFNAKSKYYYPYALGGKTGYTSKAGQCFVGEAEKDGVTLIAVVLNGGYHKTDKWLDAARLFAYGFAKQGA